jgi:archaemetzincin
MLKPLFQSILYGIVLIFFSLCSCKQRQPKNNPTIPATTNKTSKVVLLPYQGFDTSLLGFVKMEVELFYKINAISLPGKALPAFAFYKPRNRYKADSLLAYQKSILTANTTAIVGLTSQDISTSKGGNPDWGVFGLGLQPGQCCVISTFRLARAPGSNELFKQRLAKVVLHELGHNFGLPHCDKDIQCLMSDASGTLARVDREKKVVM